MVSQHVIIALFGFGKTTTRRYLGRDSEPGKQEDIQGGEEVHVASSLTVQACLDIHTSSVEAVPRLHELLY
jgi:hypothetical protein